MSAQLRLSKNELSSLLMMGFQGLFGHHQDWAAMAQAILWLDMHGLRGTRCMLDALEDGDTMQPFCGSVSATDTGYHIDLKGGSAVPALPMIADFLTTVSQCHPAGEVTLINLTQPDCLAALPYICGRQGGQVSPAHLPSHGAYLDYDVSKSQSAYDAYISTGIPFRKADYDRLIAIGNRTLVESSDASRSGAGD